MDSLSEFGELALGSRLKRLSDRLMQDGAAIYQDAGIDFKPSWFPTFSLLHKHGPTAVGQIAQMLGVTHVAVSQGLEELQAKGLVQSAPSETDKRIRLVQLSPQGMELAAKLLDVWTAIRSSISEAITESGHDIVDAVTRLERCLDRKPFRARFAERWQDAVEIVPYRPDLRADFYEINASWINQDFVMEEIDKKILKNPETEILAKGGQVFFALDRRTGETLGACALMPHGGKWELTKMGVLPAARGRGIGEKLAREVIAAAREKGLPQIYLETNSKLKPAINLYRKLGFVHVPQPESSDYARSDVTMELDL